jgi:uncharacterized glyoxalase superfamily protein PhnB
LTIEGSSTHQLGTITPYFTVENADELIEFAVQVFDGLLIREDRYENGKIQHARIRIGNSIMMLNQSTEHFLANISQMYLYVDDVELRFQSALKHGAVSIMEPNLRSFGDKIAGVKDPCGNIWWIARTYP